MRFFNSEESKRKRTGKKKIGIYILAVVIGLCLIVFINFMPTFNLETSHMSLIEGKWVNVYYETEKEAAEDVFQYADAETENIAEMLGFDKKQNINIYIYDHQNTMQSKKYGYIAPLLDLDWYIGDNIGTNVILTSPANPGKVHDYDNNKYAVLHEIVHAHISVKNPSIHLWLTEGMALYLSNGEEFNKEYLENMTIPTYEDTCTRNPIRFSNCGGYTFANTYIEYLNSIYGWNKVLELIETENYEQVLGKTSKEIYDGWTLYLKNHYE